jgi:SAM-dependent methyltransferase
MQIITGTVGRLKAGENVFGACSKERPPRMMGVMRAIAEWTTIEEHERVLDLACMDGALLAYLTGKYRLRACGVCDNPEHARAVRGLLPDADVLSARPIDIPWRDSAFDVVLSALSASSYDDFDRVLAEVLRVLRPGGQFVLSAPCAFDQSATPRSLMRRLQQTGFENVSWRMFRLNGVCIAWKKPELT